MDTTLLPPSSSNLRPMENIVRPAAQEKRKPPPAGKPKSLEKPNLLYLKNLQCYVKELSEENQQLKMRNAELEALLAAASDEIEEHEKALLELSAVYQELLDRAQPPPKGKRQRKKRAKSQSSEEPANN